MSVIERVGPLADLPEGQPLRVEIGDRAVSVVRIGDDVYAIGDRCSHQDVSLSEGDVDCDERTLECWKHGSAFSLETGEPTSLPATKPVPVYEVRVVDGQIEVVVEGG
jgi:3-phenylpropionate/trans-cinnamate dioxygenase ferredoxin subunit